MIAVDLRGILACPTCKQKLGSRGGEHHCQHCDAAYPIQDETSFFLGTPGVQNIDHEWELDTHDSYVMHVAQIVESLLPDQVMLDLGAGNRRISIPQVIRLDVAQTPYVDIVADAHALPFVDNCVDLVYATAVFEHLHSPYVAAEEILRVLKPGGTVVADCNFVFPFHGFPAVYFNASGDGMRQLFSAYEEVDVFVAPWQMPSFALESFVGEYLKFFQPETELEREFVEALSALDRFPIREFDQRFSQKDALRIAAATTYVGTKPLNGSKPWSAELMALADDNEGLEDKYPSPSALYSGIANGAVDSLLIWARAQGASNYPKVAEWLDSQAPFLK